MHRTGGKTSNRGFLIVWVALLLALALLAGWSVLSPAVSNKNAAFASYQKLAAIPNQGLAGKLPVNVGISIEKISDFSIKNVAWNADFYVWFRWKQPADDPLFNPGDTFQIVAGTISSKQKIADETNSDEHYALYRVSASVNYPFDVTRYPVDDHLLRLFIVDPVHPDIQYIADRQNSRVSTAISIPGYQIAKTVIGAETVAENTNLGNPSSPRDFARFGFGIFILRQGYGFYIKLFQALFAAVGVALLSGFFKAHEEIRIELLVGGFFAAVANSYITSTYLPDTGSMTLMDKINAIGLVTIFLCMIQTVISGRFVKSGGEEFSRLFDKISFGLIAVLYLTLNIALPLASQIH
jgi:hypothetical protein